MKVDYYLPMGAEAGDSVEHAALAERVGFDGFFTAEASQDPFLPIAVGSAIAGGLDYGTAIAVAFPRSPMFTAMTAWDLQKATKGRFLLGLGTQVKGHINRRFSTDWGSPGPRLREYIEAMRAIWTTFQEGVPLDYRGDFYQFTLMTPFFNPGPIDHPFPRVYISAVGPYNCRLVGEICDGIHVHPFHTVEYLRSHVRPLVEEGATKTGRSIDDVEFASTVMCVTGVDDESMSKSMEAARQQISFSASTPSYRAVLEKEGWDFGPELTAMSKRQKWDEMTGLITDDVVEKVAVVAPVDELGAALQARYGGLLDRIGYYTLGDGIEGLDEDELVELIRSTKG